MLSLVTGPSKSYLKVKARNLLLGLNIFAFLTGHRRMQPFTQTPYLQPSISFPHSWTLQTFCNSFVCLPTGWCFPSFSSILRSPWKKREVEGYAWSTNPSFFPGWLSLCFSAASARSCSFTCVHGYCSLIDRNPEAKKEKGKGKPILSAGLVEGSRVPSSADWVPYPIFVCCLYQDRE